LKFRRKPLGRHGLVDPVVTQFLASCGAVLKILGAITKREVGPWLNSRAENSHQPFRRRERAMLRFRRMRRLQEFAAVRSSIHNHFNQERLLVSRENFAPRTFGSRNAAPPHSPRGVKYARPDPCRSGGLFEAFLARLTASAEEQLGKSRHSVPIPQIFT
jgi:hypothetical protein